MSRTTPPLFPILAQPDDSSCGPTSLHAIYQYYKHEISLEQILAEVYQHDEGGTLGVCLGLDALRRGFRVRHYSYNLRVFDPSWHQLPPEELREKLSLQLKHKTGKRFGTASRSYIEFLEAGGEICFADLSEELLRFYLTNSYPILTGLSSTYLYQGPREREVSPTKMVFDDLRGEPTGHFVVLYDFFKGNICVADPYAKNPLAEHHHYQLSPARVLNAIMLGIMTYDANFLIIAPELPNAENSRFE